jgi:hypothetical protein
MDNYCEKRTCLLRTYKRVGQPGAMSTNRL